ncbi:autophagy protein Atg8 ubiquitin-like protein (macronuclear) [Tetrahymena thermophila SB210]|uniref:Autophagy-related protein n=1 Tax=Tetrahymena thermophila (strain SB210) TaxID=312017 RepID=W7WX53_TETTS|nr:autophagy protein Atg8 ubiquitin-like protein [Tetrahymena thermophila SB210]EWS71385.1 autophagy protein Atg8 ubiquitin-like protein [Tetrahymena thermophila SB210]|eukprot:XP_012656086.1 autophagy protein Atg8 ubiquitin-like protein [Tetrahymena thermophila SB210]
MMQRLFEIIQQNKSQNQDLTHILYKYITPVNQRIKECKQILDQYPDYVPLIIEKHPNSKLDDFKKLKLVIQGKMDILKVQSVIRNNIKLNENEAVSIFVHNGFMEQLKLLNLGSRLSDLYKSYKSTDGFLYITYCEFSSFG